MRQCQCGGQVKEHVLTSDRVAWSCQACGRYQINKEYEIGANTNPVQRDVPLLRTEDKETKPAQDVSV